MEAAEVFNGILGHEKHFTAIKKGQDHVLVKIPSVNAGSGEPQ